MLPHEKLKKRRRYRSCRRKPPSDAEIFFAISRRIRQFWIIWDKLFFLKKITLDFAFDTFNFLKNILNFFFANSYWIR